MADYAYYRDIGGPEGHLANLRPFEGNSLSAAIENAIYVVRSWGTAIAYVSASGEVTIVDKYWSHSTTRGQNLCRAWLATKKKKP